ELTDIFTIQDQISRAITDALRIELVGGEVLVEAPTDNMDAYGVYLQARQIFLSRGSAGFEAGIGGLKNSIDLYERATELDPTFAEAWADLAAVMMLVPEYGTPGYSGTEHIPIARTAAERAINLKPTLSQAWAVKGFIDLGEYKFLDAETALTHALNLNANNASALLWLGQVNAAVGKHKEAIKFIERAIELSPNTGINYLFLLASLVADGQIEKANAIIEQRKGTSTGIDTQANVLLAIEDKNWQLAKEKAMELARLVISFTDEEQKIEYDQMIELNIRAFYEPEFREQAKAAFIEYDGNLTDFIFLTVQDAELTVEGLKLGRTNKGLGLIFTYLPFKRELFRNKIFRDYLFEIGLFDYWKSNQFPDICRALGEDDFECQDGEGNWPT
ncbi:MAG: hypothetical protein HOH18_07560, partial [Kordiimonadaceae bacterium]|nr:hypothetical protein [Kordiimonadaceae bacterium]